jgi:hypothetical protein
MSSMRSSGVEVKEAIDALTRVAALDLTACTGAEVEELALLTHDAVAVATAAHTRAMAALDVSRQWEVDGARSAAAWLAWRRHLPMGRARAVLRCGRELRDLPLTEAAFLEGRVTSDHVRLLAQARDANPDAFERCEADLLGLAESLLFQSFQVAIRYWCHRHDPDGVEAEAVDRWNRRHVSCSPTWGGVAIDGWLDPVSGEIVKRELDRLEQEMFDAEWAELRDRDGDGASVGALARATWQRRADALVEMARRSASLAEHPDRNVPARVLLSVLTGDESLARICELSSGTVVTPGEVLPLLNACELERLVFESPSRVVDVGVRQRCFTGATRRAIEVRDRQCVHESCTLPAERCEIDHQQPYAEGGLTVQENGECRCAFHHRWRHRTGSPAA